MKYYLRLLIPSNHQGSDEVSDIRGKWFLAEVTITVITVSGGHTFAGLNDYIGKQVTL